PFGAGVGGADVAAIRKTDDAVETGILGVAALELDAALVQAGEHCGREPGHLAGEGVTARDQVRQHVRLRERELPGEDRYERLRVVLEDLRAPRGAERGDEITAAIENDP